MSVWPRSLPELVAAGLLVGAVLSGCQSRSPYPSTVTAPPQTWEVRERLPVQRTPEPEPRPTSPRITQQQQNASGTPRGGQQEMLAGEARSGGTSSWTRATSQTELFGEPPSTRAAGDASSAEADQGQSPSSSQATGTAAGSNADAQGEQQGAASPTSEGSEGRAGPSASTRAAGDASFAQSDQGQSPPSSQATGTAAGSNADAQGEQQGAASPSGDRSSGQAGQSTGDESLPELAPPSGAFQADSAADDSAAPVYRDVGTGSQSEENTADAGQGGSAIHTPVADEATEEPMHEGDAADADDAAEPHALPHFGGSTDATEFPPQRAKDAGWAVRPESVDAGGEPAESSLDGLGGGQSGSSSGAQTGEGAGGDDGSGEGIGGATAPSDRSGTPGTTEQTGEIAAVGTQQEESRDAAPPTGEGSAAGQTAHDPTSVPMPAAQPDTGSRPDRESPPARPISPEELESPEPAPQPMGSEKWHKEVRGAWKLVTVLDPSNDFLPQGASERLIGIDPDARVLRAVMTWTGTVAVSMAVEYEVGFRPKRVEVLPLPHAPSKFPTQAGPLLGGGHFEPSLLPPPCELSWARRGTRLTIGGAVYEAADPDVMIDVLSQPEARNPESDVVGWESEGQGDVTAAATVDFFGVQAEGRYFCYIVDISGSMKNNGGMLRLRMELERSLGSLPAGTRFSVLPFNSTLRELQPNWTSASPAKAQDIGRRLSRIGARGGTNPTGAFNWAFRELRPQPDAIFFMTDGQMKGIGRPLIETLGKLNASNPRTRVYTIGLGDDADMRFLEAVADQHGGTSRLVR
jgi:hypothetical protein